MTESSFSNPAARRRSLRWYALRATLPAAIGVVAVLAARPAMAVPSFADQTGQPCQACHVGGFGPQLTPFGREFKLNGYTMRAKAFNVPLAAMALASYTHTRKDQVPAPDKLNANDNLAFDQGSLFVAGGVGQHFGGFAQMTYDGVARHWSWDNLDLRAVTNGRVLGSDAVFGVTLNNTPMVQDVWNTTTAWGFPYTDTAVSGTPGAAPLIDGALAQNTLGVSAYSWIGHKLYIEAGAYGSPSAGTLRWLGADPTDPGKLRGLAPYGRVAYQQDLAGGTLELGAFALKAAIDPGRDASTGKGDRYSDLGLDASFLKSIGSGGDTLTAQMRYIHESSNLAASCLLAALGPDCAHNTLSQLRGDLAYNWRGKLGATLGAFSTTGSHSAFLYSGPLARPDSSGVMAQLDYTPWGGGNSPFGPLVNMRLGVQYTAYGRFDGASHNYDGAGDNASDNNALRVFTWLAF
ncbi:hypothetical protein [Novosphingobium sp.]|uniref:hypothetical protein n=1 Tax=Novosphingobium sp. TaxID=1874826 RepID=UPI0038B70049